MSAQSDFNTMIADFFNDDPQTATYHQYEQGFYSTVSSKYTSVQVDTTVKVITLDLTRNSNGLSSKYGTDILAGDKDVYMSPMVWGVMPFRAVLENINFPDTTSDKITISGVLYKVCNAKVLDPTGASPMLFNFLVRR
jgi:hypothetical protein